MENPWKEISLADYENHMKLDSVMQLQIMNEMMKGQFYTYPVSSIMILGIAGGNDLEHIQEDRFDKIYGIDINSFYLQTVVQRYSELNSILECLCIDLINETDKLPKADMVIANLLIEYIGYDCFQKVIVQTSPKYVSCIIQINTNDSFVSDSPYIHVFDGLNEVHHQMQEDELNIAMKNIKYYLISRKEQILPNRKILVQLDYRQ